MILSAQSIRHACREHLARPLVKPFHERTKLNGRTFGLSGCGYDVRLAKGLWLFPFWGRLGSIVEYLDLPTGLCAEVKDKSTNARLFVFVQNTVIEPGWRGYLTVELTRFKPWPIYLREGTPIAQIMFKSLDVATKQPYVGKYQDQREGAQAAILE